MELTAKEAILLWKLEQEAPTTTQMQEWLKKKGHTIPTFKGELNSDDIMARKNITLEYNGDCRSTCHSLAQFKLEIDNSELYQLEFITIPVITGEILGEVLENLL